MPSDSAERQHPVLPAYAVIEIADILPYERNPRQHSPAQVEQLAAAIQKWGFTNPILVDEGNGLIAGHGRLMAAQSLAMRQVPAIVVAGLSKAERQALVIADNKLGLNSTWDTELLQSELGELASADFDLGLIGFAENEIASMSAPDLDMSQEWQGMPEFEHGNKVAYQSIIIHFADAEAVVAFGTQIGQSFTSKTKSTWYPRQEQRVQTDKRYVAADPA